MKIQVQKNLKIPNITQHRMRKKVDRSSSIKLQPLPEDEDQPTITTRFVFSRCWRGASATGEELGRKLERLGIILQREKQRLGMDEPIYILYNFYVVSHLTHIASSWFTYWQGLLVYITMLPSFLPFVQKNGVKHKIPRYKYVICI